MPLESPWWKWKGRRSPLLFVPTNIKREGYFLWTWPLYLAVMSHSHQFSCNEWTFIHEFLNNSIQGSNSMWEQTSFCFLTGTSVLCCFTCFPFSFFLSFYLPQNGHLLHYLSQLGVGRMVGNEFDGVTTVHRQSDMVMWLYEAHPSPSLTKCLRCMSDLQAWFTEVVAGVFLKTHMSNMLTNLLNLLYTWNAHCQISPAVEECYLIQTSLQ